MGRLIRKSQSRSRHSGEAGFSLIELLIAGIVLTVGALAVVFIVSIAISTNNRNKIDSTKIMLTQSVLEEVHATLVGTGTGSISDCLGNSFSIATAAGGSKLQGGGTHPTDSPGSDIDFTESSPPANYHMDYVVAAPCGPGGTYIATYDVRWHVDQVGSGAGTPTSSFLVTVGSRMKGQDAKTGRSALLFSFPTNLRMVVGRSE